MVSRSRAHRVLFVLLIIRIRVRIFLALCWCIHYFLSRNNRISPGARAPKKYSMTAKIPYQISHIRYIIDLSDDICRNNLRMPRNAFKRLCFLLENVGDLRDNKHVRVEEQVAMFLSILSHHKKNVTLQTDFKRSGQTISAYFHRVLNSVLKLYPLLAITPQPIPDNYIDPRWKYFKGCLGALDGTYVAVRVPRDDKGRYRNRKGQIAVNVLAVCDKNMNFIYVLTGWEGSAADCRILRDAVTRAQNNLVVPNGCYYLVDGGYTNGPGFLAPYRGVRYHLQEFSNGAAGPQNFREFFNLKHAKARNVIERAFGILKSRWAILRSPAFYPIKQQNHIILACCLLHNFIRTHTDFDPEEANVPEYVVNESDDEDEDDVIDSVEPSQQWTNWRDALANSMYNDYLAHRA